MATPSRASEGNKAQMGLQNLAPSFRQNTSRKASMLASKLGIRDCLPWTRDRVACPPCQPALRFLSLIPVGAETVHVLMGRRVACARPTAVVVWMLAKVSCKLGGMSIDRYSFSAIVIFLSASPSMATTPHHYSLILRAHSLLPRPVPHAIYALARSPEFQEN